MEGETLDSPSMSSKDDGNSDTLPTQMETWDHFTPYTDNNGKTRAECKCCERTYAVGPSMNVTSEMNNHTKTCKNHPDNQTIAGSCGSVNEETRESWKFDQEATRKALARMIIIDELPFKFVENEGFRQFVSVACPEFIIPSRTAIIGDCYRLYFDEKNKLKTYFKITGQRISLTVDTWTSSQRLTYMCLTAHYIDTDWKMQKVILNFIPRPTHKGDDVGLLIEKCLLDWGIDRIFTITVDNTSSNDTIVAYLRRKFVNQGTAVLGGKFLHMRCVAHIVNLIVKDGLKELNESIERVRTVVRYVLQSLAKLKKFNNFVVEEKVESKRSLCLDVPTRWDSIYTMLETAVIFQRVFERYEMSDADFRGDFMPDGPYGKIGLPTKYDWDMVERFVKVLQYFYKLIVQISGSLYVTSNIFLDEISEVDYMLKEWLRSDDDILVDMARQIKVKFDKYWGDVEKMNMMLYVAVMLDPRLKFSYVEYVF
ncbi:UNVERIFIED_CONTAM: putative AC transposase [Sesamum radiatum]|uniref:AC transposase n=1 Tax=Sesamum radiatum TaxID=300843 RepID=A0AAW2NB70_SESRA